MLIYLASATAFLWSVGFVASVYQILNKKRLEIIKRLQSIRIARPDEEEDILERPFLERTMQPLTRGMVYAISQIAPNRLFDKTEEMLIKAGNQGNRRPLCFVDCLP
ncbi:MAG TPA: hypothetical protein GX524_03510 [Firmicutes bacterium]|nr:hypothetical protein [Bacillota bacterium]